MNYYAYINGKNYKLIQGFTISEEYNETLDSGTIMISNVPQLDLNPYDDVIIYSTDDDTGTPFDKTYDFFKHFLIDQFQEEVIRLDNESYRYTIQLFSETKGLENIQLPNISITQPLDASKKISTVEYIKRFLTMYNKKVKVPKNKNSNLNEYYYWEYKNKYRLASSDNGILESIPDVFKNSYTPDFTLNNPNLRDVLAKLLITKDRIPVVKNNLIYCLDITKRRGNFDINKGEINYIYGSKSSDNYCTDLRRNYSEALAQDYTGKYTEFLGFRNSDSPLLTFSNMRIETKFPIYKVNKLYMCYYKKAKKRVVKKENDKITDVVTKDVVFLCKQDITPLLKLNSERNCLSQDITDFNTQSKTIETLSKYKLSTIGYDIGSRFIEGWGSTYNYPKSFFWQNEESSYIENIFNFMDNTNPLGILNLSELIENSLDNGENKNNVYMYVNSGKIDEVMAIPEQMNDEDLFKNTFGDFLNNIVGVDTKNITLYYKHLFFEIEYQPFYSGTIIQSKGFGKENITVNDNASSSLTLLELDGLAQKEKINRFGNKGIQINARYDNIDDLQSLGSVYNRYNDEDVVIYHREYSINDNVINCTYYGMKDYVLKNYFTSVYAKHRTYNLMSYGESITRSENERNYFLFSKTRQYNDSNSIISSYSFNNSFSSKLFDFYKGISNYDEFLKQEHNEINFAYFKSLKGDNIYWLTDSNIFVSGNSLCMNMKMSDNVVAGVSVSNIVSDYAFLQTDTYITGGKQKWIWMPDDAINDEGSKSGTIKKLGFYFGHNDSLFGDNLVLDYSNNIIENKYQSLFSLPQINTKPIVSNQIGIDKIIYKDNKEIMDMTIQFEALNDKGIYISPWLFKLSGLYGVYPKYSTDFGKTRLDSDIYFTGCVFLGEQKYARYPMLCIVIKKDMFNEISNENFLIDNEVKIEFNNRSEEVDKKDDFGVIGATWTIYKNTLMSVYMEYNESKGGKYVFAFNMNENFKGKYSTYNTNRDILRKFECFTDDETRIDIPEYMTYYLKQSELKKVIIEKVLKLSGNVDDYLIFHRVWNPENGDFIEKATNDKGKNEAIRRWAAFPSKFSSDATPDDLNKNEQVEYRCFNSENYAEQREATCSKKQQDIIFTKQLNYNKNLFFYYTRDDFKEYMVYDELKTIPLTYKTLNNVIVENSNGHLKFNYNLENDFYIDTKILLYYKKDDKYNFVFGFNADNPEKTTIYISSLSSKSDIIYDDINIIPIGKMKNIAFSSGYTPSEGEQGWDNDSSNNPNSPFNPNKPNDFETIKKTKIIVRFYDYSGSTHYTDVEYEKFPTLIESIEYPSRNGYVFKYWATENGYKFDFENRIIDYDLVLYGIWEPKKPITIIFNDSDIPNQIINAGDTIVQPQDPTRDGYLFKWWYKFGGDEESVFDFNTKIYEDTNLTAKWVKAYKITYKVLGYDDVIEQVEENTKTNPPTNPIKEGHEFLGWYTEDDTLFNFDNEINNDIVLTAKFKLLQVKVTFYITPNNAYQEKWISIGTKVTKPSTDPTRNGYTFNGWDFDFDTIINQDTSIYAKWLGAGSISVYFYSSSEEDFNTRLGWSLGNLGQYLIWFFDSSELPHTAQNRKAMIRGDSSDFKINFYSGIKAGIDGGVDINNKINNPATYNNLPAVKFITNKNVIGNGPYYIYMQYFALPASYYILINGKYYKGFRGKNVFTETGGESLASFVSNDGIFAFRVEALSVIEENNLGEIVDDVYVF